MELPRTLTDAERKAVDAFLAILTPEEFRRIEEAFPQTTGRPESRLRPAIVADGQRRKKGHG
jgi:hypothetical protein